MNRTNTYYKPAAIEFITDDFKLVLFGYPLWEASIAAAESDIWIKVIPSIDISKRIIYQPITDETSSNLDHYALTEIDLVQSMKPYYNEKMNSFFDSIPPNFTEAVSRFPDSHWDFIKAINLLGVDLLTLVKNNPVLAYAVVNMEKINPSFICYTNKVVLQRMIRTKQKEILKLLGFPEAERMVKIFSKMEPASIKVQDLIGLRNVLMIRSNITEHILKVLSFAKSINKRLIRFINVGYLLIPKMTHKLIFALVNSRQYNEKLKSLFEILCYVRQLDKQIPHLASLPSITIVNQRLKKELGVKLENDMLFPSAPLPDDCYVQAINTEAELYNWSYSQQNCIRDYAEKVRSGKCYFYRVIYNDEEATLELKLNMEKIRRGDLRGKCNCKVSPELKKIVEDWLKDKRGS